MLQACVVKREPNFAEEPRVLDVGSGLGVYHASLWKQLQLVGGRLFLLDAHAPYMVHRLIPPDVVQIVGTARVVLPTFAAGAFNVILAVDFVEHLAREAALDVIRHMQRATRHLCVFTPDGPHPQDKDPTGLDGDHWQTHRSAWRASDLEELGFHVETWPDLHLNDKPETPGALWAEWTASPWPFGGIL